MPEAPRTIGDVNKKRLADKAVVDANAAAAADLDAKIKADSDTFSASTAEFATDLKSIGDFFELGQDGTATAYFASPTAPDGFYSEVLKPASTPVDAAPAPVDVTPPVDVVPTPTPEPTPVPDQPAPEPTPTPTPGTTPDTPPEQPAGDQPQGGTPPEAVVVTNL